MPIDEALWRQRLETRRAELEKLTQSAEAARETSTPDQTSVGRLSRVDAMQRQAMADATERQRLVELARVHAALERLEEGEFGYCLSCGEEIAPRRLEVDPAATLCIACAARGED